MRTEENRKKKKKRNKSKHTKRATTRERKAGQLSRRDGATAIVVGMRPELLQHGQRLRSDGRRTEGRRAVTDRRSSGMGSRGRRIALGRISLMGHGVDKKKEES